MVTQYDEVALCAQVQNGKVEYFKEYSLNGRHVGAECIPYAEFVRLLNLWGTNKRKKSIAEVK
jgi:1,6-anhydro-N-acetylmuramate kinase